MSDSSVIIRQDTGGDRPIDNELVTTAAGLVYRQRIAIATPTTPQNGQKLVAVTNTAVALAATTAVAGVIISALAANSGNVYVGSSAVTTANGFELQPGQATSIAIDDVAKMYVNGTAGDGVCWMGS